MGDWPAIRPADVKAAGVISVATLKTPLFGSAAAASTAWPAANLAIFVPLLLPIPVIITKLAIGAGATAAGNFDVGIFDSAGHKLVSSGATAKGADTEQVIDVTDTQIGPGIYYFGMSADGTNNYAMFSLSVSIPRTRIMGAMEQTTAYTLPATATFAAAASFTFLPAIAAYFRTY